MVIFDVSVLRARVTFGNKNEAIVSSVNVVLLLRNAPSASGIPIRQDFLYLAGSIPRNQRNPASTFNEEGLTPS